ncbi:hypothetical protein SDC9_153331 [bioreactor metagenome]|uniref:Uncharacterized protein n=1 Tax=bioreactor metagenome TaxID=1076179 RepID=A0A645EXD6_9ZZZZ
MDGLRTQPPPPGGMTLQRGQFAGKHHRIAGAEIKQRLFAQPVAHQVEFAALADIDCQCEHAVQPRQSVDAVAGKKFEYHLGVAPGTEPRAARFQLHAQLPEIVDFAVEDDHQPVRGIRHRLVGRFGKIDDRQPPVRKPGIVAPHHPLSIRTAVSDRLRHRGGADRVTSGIGALKNTGYATHGIYSLSGASDNCCPTASRSRLSRSAQREKAAANASGAVSAKDSRQFSAPLFCTPPETNS